MTTFFSWMLERTGGQVRLVLAHDVVIRMDREWDAEQWVVRFATLNSHAEGAQRSALTETESLERNGFTLSGPICTVTTNIKPSGLYVENAPDNPPGPLLRGLFQLTWSDL